jgi:type II secretory pathway component PulM
VKRAFLQLEPRVQWLTAIGGVAVAAVVVAVVLVSLHSRHAAAVMQLSATEASLREVRTLVAQLQSLQAADNSPQTSDLTALVSRSLQSFDLQPSRLQQNSADELQLRLDAVPFATAIAWLGALEQMPGVVVVRASFSQGPDGNTTLSLSLRSA